MRAALLIAIPVFTVGLASARAQQNAQQNAAPAPPPKTITYEACIAKIENAPKAAQRAAEDWVRAGGGLAARHCEAMAMAANGAPRAAAAQLQKMAETSTDAPPAERAALLAQAGDLWMSDDRPDAARTTLDAAIRLTPEDPELYTARAEAAAQEKDWAAAIADLDIALGKTPGNARRHALRAAAKRRAGDLPGAYDDAKAASRLAPDDPLGWFERGAAEREMGDAPAAKRSWLRAAEIDPKSPAGNLAQINLQKLEAQ